MNVGHWYMIISLFDTWGKDPCCFRWYIVNKTKNNKCISYVNPVISLLFSQWLFKTSTYILGMIWPFKGETISICEYFHIQYMLGGYFCILMQKRNTCLKIIIENYFMLVTSYLNHSSHWYDQKYPISSPSPWFKDVISW